MELEFEALNKTTLAEQVMQQLAAKIIAGELPTGHRLPAERDLAESMGVSRGRVREALRALALVGLVDIRPGGGAYVCDGLDQMPKDTVLWLFRQEATKYSDLYAARELIEPAVYTACFNNKTDEVIAGIFEHVDRIAKANENKDISGEAFLQLLDEEDLYVGVNCGNSVFYKLMQTIILLRRELCIHICESPANRDSSVEKRTLIANAFRNNDQPALKKAWEYFFSVRLEI